jgi:hypothetical protein
MRLLTLIHYFEVNERYVLNIGGGHENGVHATARGGLSISIWRPATHTSPLVFDFYRRPTPLLRRSRRDSPTLSAVSPIDDHGGPTPKTAFAPQYSRRFPI